MAKRSKPRPTQHLPAHPGSPLAGRIVNMLAAFAEHELEQISQRTKDALAAAKARGIRLGRNAADRLDPAYRAAAMERARQLSGRSERRQYLSAPFAWSIFSPAMEPDVSTTNTTSFGMGSFCGRSDGGARSMRK